MNNLGTKTLKTQRLTLRKFNVNDAFMVYKNFTSDDKVTKFLSWETHKDEEQTREIIKQWIKEYENNDTYNWVVEVADSKEIIGGISVVRRNNAHGICEIGYDYGSKYWGQGYATEALREVCRFLLQEVGYRIIECYHVSGNPASGRVMEKAGLRKDGVLRSRRVDKRTGQVYDLVCYSITNDEIRDK